MSEKKLKALSGKKTKLWVWLGFILANLIIILTTVLVRHLHNNDSISNAFLYLINRVYLDNYLKQPAMLLASLTLVGYLILGRGLRESIIGAMKTAIGYLLLGIGAGVIVGMAKPLFSGLVMLSANSNSNVAVIPLDPYFGLLSANNFLNNLSEGTKYASWITYVFTFGFFINMILVALKKWTNTHSLMVTGHVMFQQSAIAVTIIYVLLFRDVPTISGVDAKTQAGVVIISSLFMGTYWAVGSSATIKGTNAVTENADFAIGHQQMLAIALTYKISRFFGNKEQSAESRVLPKWSKIFEDNIFTQTVILSVLFVVIILITQYGQSSFSIFNDKGAFQDIKYADVVKKMGNETLALQWFGTPSGSFAYSQWNVLGGANPVFNIIFGSLKVVAGLIGLMTGVRMFVTELQQAFQGVSEKLLPDSVVAIDIAATYGFSPNSITYGFFAGTIGQFISVGLVIGLSLIPNLPIVIGVPLFITLFFNSGALGIYANASGGYRAALIVPFLIGFLEVLLISFSLGVLKSSINDSFVALAGVSPISNGFIGMADWNLFFGSINLLGIGAIPAGWTFVILGILGLLVFAQIFDSGKQKHKTFLQKLFKLNPQLITE